MRISQVYRPEQALPTWNLPKPEGNAGPKAATTTTFSGMLKEALATANRLELHAQAMDARLALGEQVDLHDVVIASEKAKLSLDLVVQVRNKAIEAYQEIMRMQV
ncbi:MAG: flagellar hook-basal body complex protein FliE [Bacillota bacterium]